MTTPPAEALALIRFDVANSFLWQGDQCIVLRPKDAAVLHCLLAHVGQVVTKHTLLEAGWPETFVSEGVLKDCIYRLRHALGDTAKVSRFIETVPRRGYRLRREIPTVAAPEARPDTQTSGRIALSREVLVPQPGLTPAGSSGAIAPAESGPTFPVSDDERKQVTVISCSLAEMPVLAERLGAEGMHTLLQRFFALARREVQYYGGMITRYLEAGFLALFGAPQAQEDHARRAVLAALRLQQRFGAPGAEHGLPHGTGVAMRLGLHSGLVVVGGLVDERRQITAVGDTLTFASVLQEQAAPGTILISEATSRLLRATVQIEAEQSVLIEGQAAPGLAFRVIGELAQSKAVAGRWGRGMHPFVGRQQELALLDERLGYVEGGQGQVISITGESGIGKSRLLYEFCRSLGGRALTYCEGHCLSYGIATPYLPVRELLSQLCELRHGERCHICHPRTAWWWYARYSPKHGTTRA